MLISLTVMGIGIPRSSRGGDRRWSMRYVRFAGSLAPDIRPTIFTFAVPSFACPQRRTPRGDISSRHLFASHIGEITIQIVPEGGTYRRQIVNSVHHKRMTALQRGGSRSPLYDLRSDEVFYRITQFIEAQGFSPG